MEEPPMKKMKPETIKEIIENIIKVLTESKNNLKAVLSQDLYDNIPKTKVYAGQIKDPKELSKVIQILNEKLPLKTLQHLKRVRKKDVLLFTSSELNNATTIQEFLEEIVPELSSSFEYFKEIDVPALAPKLKRQSIEANRLWSCNFHPNSYLEQLASDNCFNDGELKTHKECMRMAFEIARKHLMHNLISSIDNIQNLNACVVYDPSIQSVVAVSFDNRENHPIQHSAMIAIDNVAKTQHGGAWCTDNKGNIRLSGIDSELLTYLREKFENTNFGAKAFRPKSEITDDTYGPYLCTGYYVYMIREPCLMCAMALVHARVKRVFFCIDNPNFGSLKSRTELQSVPFLNHHFEVFTGFLL
ncbi:probable inactive tRNA-specific adenosine deaminase-like protein 3 [Plodia interpunctella]|uniref:probable inactive tRNA-specific adenosine deaminase-like protein 3 n=1 Tax=Plodia interpunctella TaxID=58824 RepID=UPI002368186A|nr:probable inactive tRNA-specific adenosine deaminase-like protein 3 [Plodia interpunctella]